MTKKKATEDARSIRGYLYETIFEAETSAGKAFDLILIFCILASVSVIILDSIPSVREDWGETLGAMEWAFTILFTIEYVLRVISAKNKLRYMRSFFGLIDFFAILPTYLSLIIPGVQSFTVVRILRVLRIFRILRLAFYVGDSEMIVRALTASRRKITVFLFTVFLITVILGSTMYVVEGSSKGFESIPEGIYWAIVTLTTVGYGDIVPVTPLGRLIASAVMILGYAIIAVPTGIVTVELSRTGENEWVHLSCTACGEKRHARGANFCSRCAAPLPTHD